MPMPSLTEQIRCIEREIKRRREHYPRLVEHKRLTPTQASREITCMTAALHTLRELANREVTGS